MQKKIRMAFVGLDQFPIPAIKGGAIERIVTSTMDLNEKYQLYDLTVITIMDPDLNEEIKKYKHCKVIQVNQDTLYSKGLYLYRIIRKLTGYVLPLKSAYMHGVNKVLLRENFDIVQFVTANEQVAQISDKVKSLITYEIASDYLNKDSYGIKKILSRVDYFIAGPYLSNRLKIMLNVSDNQIIQSSFSIDSTTASNATREKIRKEIRQKHGIGDEELVMLFVGRLNEGKGPLQLIQAMQRVKNCRLIVVGGSNFNSAHQTNYVKSLYEAAKKCEKEVIFTGYVKDHDDVTKYMYAADMASVPSICNEAGSIALLEFRVASLPTVISDKGGMKDHAGGNVVTVRCDEQYVENLAEAIQKICDDENYRKSLASVAREGLENHTPEAAYRKRYKILEKILEERNLEK